jgi:gamma-glutamylcysteine synthetase
MDVTPLDENQTMCLKLGMWKFYPRVVVAYHWFQTNWKMIRTLTSRNLPIRKIAPQYENTEQWTVCLQRILREQIGLNWRKRKNGDKFELTPLSMCGSNQCHCVTIGDCTM